MLDEYREKRDFGKTPEPSSAPSRSAGKWPIFVVQKHAARNLHYDLRLEWGGVLKSWAVPKGPSLKYGDKRFAVLVEDHPLGYAEFEGVIPKGEYGGGEVIVWDRGTFYPDENPVDLDDRDAIEAELQREFEAGKIGFTVFGEKLRGSFALVRMKDAKDWLLLKHKDAYADDTLDVLTLDRSVVSGRSIEDLQGGSQTASPVAWPRDLAPMTAQLAEDAFTNPDWVFEPKLDGFRALALVGPDAVRLLSRNGNDITSQFPVLRQRLAALGGPCVLDGEIVALDEQGQASFQRLLKRFQLKDEFSIAQAERQFPVQFYAFDLLFDSEGDHRGEPWSSRRQRLERALADPPKDVFLVQTLEGDGPTLLAACIQLGFEGIVAKRKASRYQSGKRSADWLKIKRQLSDEFLVCGFTVGQGWRSATFGSLVLATQTEEGLRYVGNVGSGFDDGQLVEVRALLDPLIARECPFPAVPEMKEPQVVWLRPDLWVEVKFDSYTEVGHLRAPVFMRMRPDKATVPAQPRDPDPAPVDDLSALIAEVETCRPDTTLVVGGYPVKFSNLDKPLWTEDEGERAFTKREYVRYCLRNHVAMLRNLRDRPLTLTRFPNGHKDAHFYQKHWEGTLPPYVESIRIFSGHRGESGDYMVCNNLATLVWLAQIADLEIHTWYSRIARPGDGMADDYGSSPDALQSSALNYPDFMVFDLDPYIYKGTERKGEEPALNRAAFSKGCEVALRLRELLVSLGLNPYVKTTGKTGLHIFVPIERNLTFDQTRSASEVIGQHLRSLMPDDVTLEWAVDKRAGKIFFDYNQNVRGKTLASIYSPRATAGAKVSVPVSWDELPDVYPASFDIANVPDRVAERGDLWQDILDRRSDLAQILGLR